MEDKNDLRIELYPNNFPRCEFPQQPVSSVIPQEVYAHSFDNTKSIGYALCSIFIRNKCCTWFSLSCSS